MTTKLLEEYSRRRMRYDITDLRSVVARQAKLILEKDKLISEIDNENMELRRELATCQREMDNLRSKIVDIK